MEVTFAKEYSAILKDLLHYYMLILSVNSLNILPKKQLAEHDHCIIGYEPVPKLMSELFNF